MGIKKTLDNTTDMVRFFGNTAWDALRAIYDNLAALLALSSMIGLANTFLAQSSVALKVPVIAATTVNVALTGLQTIDGIPLTVERVLVKNQTDASENGIYTVNSGAWVRELDWDGEDAVVDVIEGTAVPVNRGTINGDSIWKVSTQGTIFVGTTNIQFERVDVVHTGDVIGRTALTIDVKKVQASMMEDGVDGELFTWDENGVLAKVAVGNIGEYLRSNGAGSPPTFQIEGPPVRESTEYCPGYVFGFVDTDTFTIDGFDVTNIFNAGRRLRFTFGGNDIFGTIDSSSFSTNTTIEMTMETDNLANVAYQVCLTTGGVGWSSIAEDPFGGSPINDISSGAIGGIHYWVAVGNTGKLATSTDQGLSWTIRTTNTTVKLNQIDYNGDDEIFCVGGNSAVILRSTDGITWGLNTSEILAITDLGNSDVLGMVYHSLSGLWGCLFQEDPGGLYETAYSSDDGVNWSDNNAQIDPSSRGRLEILDHNGVPDARIIGSTGNDGTYITAPNDTTWSTYFTQGVPTGASFAMMPVRANETNYIATGHGAGGLHGAGMGLDDTTFGSSQINDFAYSPTHTRLIAVAADGKIGYVPLASFGSGNNYTLVVNGFDPLADILCVHWDATEGLFIAGSSTGQICRSTTGLT